MCIIKEDFLSQEVGGEKLDYKGALIKMGKALMVSTSVSQSTLYLYFKLLKYLCSVLWTVKNCLYWHIFHS
jgi:hypothetical protein